MNESRDYFLFQTRCQLLFLQIAYHYNSTFMISHIPCCIKNQFVLSMKVSRTISHFSLYPLHLLASFLSYNRNPVFLRLNLKSYWKITFITHLDLFYPLANRPIPILKFLKNILLLKPTSKFNSSEIEERCSLA